MSTEQCDRLKDVYLYARSRHTRVIALMGDEAAARTLTENRLPIDTGTAKPLGFIDDHFAGDPAAFRRRIVEIAEQSANHRLFGQWLASKNRQRQEDERKKPLEAYRQEEMERMKLNFYGFDPSYHVARYNFVYKVSNSWTPLHLALHRRLEWPGKPAAASGAL